MIGERLNRRILLTAGITGATGVALGAFSAHGLENYLLDTNLDPEIVKRRLAQFETGVRYQLLHSLALLGLAALQLGSAKIKTWIYYTITLGCILFSGSLYLLVFLDKPVLGAITPLGGLSWIVAWSLITILARTCQTNDLGPTKDTEQKSRSDWKT
jgi:uncharacterized membrane protein YgdD (TMEM256/DUF423 family)